MTKLIIILFLIAVVGVLVATRYRRQIQTGIYLWRMFRKMRQADGGERPQVESSEKSKDIRLVRCARCGTWTPQKNALSLRGNIFYCSADCMENAVKVA